MLYTCFRNRRDQYRELVLRDGAPFPSHLNADEWYLHGTHTAVNGRTEADIETLGYCDRNGAVTFGRKVNTDRHISAMRRI